MPNSGRPASEPRGQHPATAMLSAEQSQGEDTGCEPIFQWKGWGGEGAPLTLPAGPLPGSPRLARSWATRRKRARGRRAALRRKGAATPAEAAAAVRAPLLAAAGGGGPAASSLIGHGAGAAMLAEAVPLCRGNWPWLRPQRPSAQPPASPRSSLGAERRRPAGWRKVG